MSTPAPTPGKDWLRITGLSIGLCILLYWTVQLLHTTDMPWIFLDYVNLIFHEAGHFIFMPFGQVLYVMGGTITQCAIPVIALASFLSTAQYGSAAFSLFWLGDSMVNSSYYIKDARTQVLPLLGNGTHDWGWLLDHWGLSQQDQLIGSIVYGGGVLCIVIALCILGYLLWYTYSAATTSPVPLCIDPVTESQEPDGISQSKQNPTGS